MTHDAQGASCVERLRDARNRLRNIGWSDEATTADEAADEIERLREALESMVQQFAYWSEGDPPGLYTGGLSALEHAFDVLGWQEPHPCPEQTCDVKGCRKQVSCGWPSDDGYRRTCGDHMREKASRE